MRLLKREAGVAVGGVDSRGIRLALLLPKPGKRLLCGGDGAWDQEEASLASADRIGIVDIAHGVAKNHRRGPRCFGRAKSSSDIPWFLKPIQDQNRTVGRACR